jgi:disulfide bond formation protein DsbB
MTPFVQAVTNFLSFFIVVFDVAGAALLIILITPLRRRGWTRDLVEFVGERAIFLSFLFALAATGASLFYSDIANFQPCLLCWWQRILLYPQVILLFVALIKKDRLVRLYSLIFSSIGVIISLYHTFLQFGGESLFPCSATGVGCEHVYFLTYGYVTIPTMSLTTFALILLIMLCPDPRKQQVNNL